LNDVTRQYVINELTIIITIIAEKQRVEGYNYTYDRRYLCGRTEVDIDRHRPDIDC